MNISILTIFKKAVFQFVLLKPFTAMYIHWKKSYDKKKILSVCDFGTVNQFRKRKTGNSYSAIANQQKQVFER